LNNMKNLKNNVDEVIKTKKCCICGCVKSLDEFNKNAKAKDGRQSQCKCCDKQYRQEHREEKAQYRVLYRQENKEIISQSSAQYYQEHREEKLQKSACYYQEHKKEKAQKIAQSHQVFSKRVVLFMGGWCVICGLETDWYEVYHCHHKNPDEKDIEIGRMMYMDWEKVVQEMVNVYWCVMNVTKFLLNKLLDQILTDRAVRYISQIEEKFGKDSA
ncbi:MAG: hypothetical protein ACHQXJ_03450, partial [Nitrososphaerales archaeon]